MGIQKLFGSKKRQSRGLVLESCNPKREAMGCFPFADVAFDLDGMLADTATDLTEALNQMLVRLGRDQVANLERLAKS